MKASRTASKGKKKKQGSKWWYFLDKEAMQQISLLKSFFV